MPAGSDEQGRRFSLRAYVVTVAVGIFLLAAGSKLPLLVSDPFIDGNRARLKLLSIMPAQTVFAIKEAHAAQAARYDVGLFGNSRSVSVGTKDIRPPAGERFFNFGIGSIDFTTSVLQLERLEAIDKAPKIALINFDHPATRHPVRAPFMPTIYGEATVTFGNTLQGFADQSPYRWWYLRQGIETFATRLLGIFNSTLWRWRISYALDGLLPERLRHTDAASFRPDGSREQVLPRVRPHYLLPDDTFIPQPAMNWYFEKLAVLRKRGVRIIVFESPLNPEIVKAVNGIYGSAIDAERKRFASLCMQFEIECHLAPLLNDGQNAQFWEDFSHAPAALLGAYLRVLISK